MATTNDPNRNCWNCKHFAPDNRAISVSGDCCVRPPRYLTSITFAFERTSNAGNDWCGNWERTDLTVPPIPTP